MTLSEIEKLTDDELIENLKLKQIPDTDEIKKYLGIRLSLMQGR